MLKLQKIFHGILSWTIYLVVDAAPNSTKSNKADKKLMLTDEMIKGLSAGFGSFLALIFFICLVWYCCCIDSNESNKPDNRAIPNNNNRTEHWPDDRRHGRRLFA